MMLTELDEWLTAASRLLTNAALVAVFPLLLVYFGCMAEARRDEERANEKGGTHDAEV